MADKLILEFQAKTDDLDKRLKSIEQSVSGIAKSAKTASKETESAASSMGSAFTKAGALIAASFTLDAVISFGKEVVDLAAKAEGVERAFKRVGSPQLLQGLRDATRGTVTDLVLMQNAVKASNFDIPLENLASLFKFAQARARETGESVDYLVDSIILGIGRKSPLILDNLGISAVELRSRLKGVGVEAANVGDIAQIIGDIATEEMEKIGTQADTSADKMAKLTTSTDNLKVALGKLIADEASGVSEFFATLANAMTLVLTENERLANELSGQSGLKILARLREEQLQLSQMEVDASNKIGKVKEAEASKILNQIDNQKELIETIQSLLDAKRSEGNEYDITTASIERALAAYKATSEAQKIEIRNVFFLTNAIKKLKEEHDAQGTSIERIKKIQQEVIPLQEELARLLGQETEATKKAREEVEKLAKAEEDRWKALEAQADDRLKKHFEVEEFISDRTARGLREQMELDLKAEVIKGANAEATAMSIGLAEDDIIAIRQASIDEQLRIEGEYRAKIQALEDESVSATQDAEDEKERIRAQANQYTVDLVQQSLSTISNMYGSLTQLAEQEADHELAILQNKYDQGKISLEQFEQEQIRIQRASAQRAKDAATFQAIIGASQAVINALSSPGVPFPVALAFSLLAAAQAAVQVAAIQSQPLPEFAEGGWVSESGKIHGRKHSEGGVKIEAEGDEYIVKGSMARRHSQIIEAVNKGTIEKLIAETYVRPAVDSALLNGWGDVGKSATINAAFNDMNLLRAIDRHRDSDKDGFKYLAGQITQAIKRDGRTSWR